jgi:hypothetical protein
MGTDVDISVLPAVLLGLGMPAALWGVTFWRAHGYVDGLGSHAALDMARGTTPRRAYSGGYLRPRRRGRMAHGLQPVDGDMGCQRGVYNARTVREAGRGDERLDWARGSISNSQGTLRGFQTSAARRNRWIGVRLGYIVGLQGASRGHDVKKRDEGTGRASARRRETRRPRPWIARPAAHRRPRWTFPARRGPTRGRGRA